MVLRIDQKFNRGLGPLISILLPTRGRVKTLQTSIESLLSKAYNYQNIEFLVKIDDDDKPTIEFMEDYSQFLANNKVDIRLFITPRGNGYGDIHLWLNELAKEAKGDWLMNWSDDCLMQSRSWDYTIEYMEVQGIKVGLSDGIYVYLFRNPSKDRASNHEFFALRKEVFNLLGHISLSPHADTWIATVMGILERSGKVPIFVEHDNDSMKDQTALDGRAITNISSYSYCEPIMVRQRLFDSYTLIKAIEDFSNKGAK